MRGRSKKEVGNEKKNKGGKSSKDETYVSMKAGTPSTLKEATESSISNRELPALPNLQYGFHPLMCNVASYDLGEVQGPKSFLN